MAIWILMTQQLLSADAFLVWHDWARVLAIGLLALIFIVTAVQFVVSGSSGSGARFLIGGRFAQLKPLEQE